MAIFDAAAAVVAEAGGTVAGGHTIRNPEPIFGLAVQGVVHPDRVFRKGGARPGDVLVLSKPIGTGLALAGGTAATRRRPSPACAASTAPRPRRCRRSATRCTPSPTSPATASPGTVGRWPSAAGCGSSSTPTASSPIRGAPRPPPRGVRTGGDPRNRDYVPGTSTRRAGDGREALCMDPQTSGGLLAALDPASRLGSLDGRRWWRVGDVAAGAPQLVLR